MSIRFETDRSSVDSLLHDDYFHWFGCILEALTDLWSDATFRERSLTLPDQHKLAAREGSVSNSGGGEKVFKVFLVSMLLEKPDTKERFVSAVNKSNKMESLRKLAHERIRMIRRTEELAASLAL